MATREEIRRRADVKPEDIDDVVGLAAELQEAAAPKKGASLDEVKDVARELDIDPRFVEEAVQKLQSDREAAAARALQEQTAKAARNAWRIRVAAGLGVLTVVFFGLTGAVCLGTVWSGASRLGSAEAEVHAAEAQLDVVLDRQEALAPQLVGLAGAELPELEELKQRAEAAQDVEQRLHASAELGTALSEAFGHLPPPGDDATAQMRLNLQYELVGTQNRITTEVRRYEDAVSAWRRVSTGFGPRAAVGLGLASAPPQD